MGPLHLVVAGHSHPAPARRPPIPRPRRRQCLLKGCEKDFLPTDGARQRYCSEHCAAEARRWSLWRGRRTYRQGSRGRECRREQSRRYRERRRSKGSSHPIDSTADVVDTPGEGHQDPDFSEGPACRRPGCYVIVAPTARSRDQAFCSKPCRQAVQRVRERERKWERSLSRWWKRRFALPSSALAAPVESSAHDSPSLSRLPEDTG